MLVMVTTIWLFFTYEYIIRNTCAEIKFAKDCIQVVMKCISCYIQISQWHSGESKSIKCGIKCGKIWTSFIKFNTILSLAEVYNGKHFSLWNFVKYVIRDSIVEWFSIYYEKPLIWGVEWSTGLMMPPACISADCCLKAASWCTWPTWNLSGW